VAWRGLLHETEAPDHVVNYLDSKFTVFQGENYHILAYVIPGPLGEVKRKFRRINWVWYCNVEEDSDELDTILTDIHGKRHGYSVPRGLLRPEVAKAQRLRAQNMLPMVLADMVNATDEIFIQAIHDMISPELAFGGKAALVGDAGCILRPHTAAGATQAAVNSWTLAASSIFSKGSRGVPGVVNTLNRVPEFPKAHDGSSIAWASRTRS